MTDLVFTQQEIMDLIRKIGTLQPYLSPPEIKLLLAIFGAAAERAKSSGVSGATLPEANSSDQAKGAGTGGPTTIQSLQQQLVSAYIPGNSFDSVTGGGATFSVTEDPGSGAQSPPASPSGSPAAKETQPAEDKTAEDKTGASQGKSKKP